MMKRRMNQSNLHDLFYTLVHGEPSALDKYILNGGSLKIVGPYKKSLLIGCIEENKPSMFERCLEMGVDLHASDDMGMAALHWAAYGGVTHFVTSLLIRGANPDLIDKEGNTALIFAAQRDHVDIVRCLLESGCSSNVRNEEGYTALHFASQQMKIETVRLLLVYGSDGGVKTNHGDSPITFALSNKDLKTMQVILEHSMRSSIGYLFSSDLQIAVKRRSNDALQMLLSFGVDPFPDYEDCSQWTEILTSGSCRRLRESLISEYGYITSSERDNKLLMYIFKKHMFLQLFGILKLMFLYGLQIHNLEEMLHCKEKCLCRKVIADFQKQKDCATPGSLMVLCRTKIRKFLGLGIVRKIHNLPLPGKMIRYLCLSSEYCLEKPLV